MLWTALVALCALLVAVGVVSFLNPWSDDVRTGGEGQDDLMQ